MFKITLHEYCQSKAWPSPTYVATKNGLAHCLRFRGEVTVNGISFTSPRLCTSINEAHNLAAKFAYEQLVGYSELFMASTSASAADHIQLPNAQPASSTNTSQGANRVTEDNNMLKDMRMYKNQLQEYAQKRNLEFPVYTFERVGPSHASLFKAKVTLEGKTYESEFFHTLKEAESVAAKVALASLIPKTTQELQDDSVMYKNLLQQFLQKALSCLPKYTTDGVGPPHRPIFVSTVEIQGETFRGQEAKTKKQAEMNVAKVAYITLRERLETTPNLKATASIPKPNAYPNTRSSSINPRPLVGSSFDNVTNKKKRKNFSQSSGGSHANTKPRIHSPKNLQIPQRTLTKAHFKV